MRNNRWRPPTVSLGLLGPAILSGCLAAPVPPDPAGSADPRKQEVELPAAPGWRASLVLDNGDTGVWTVKAFQVFPQYACPEVVGLDDQGRCHVIVSYSGKWTPVTAIEDGLWLGGLAHGDVDPRIEGTETYTGGKRGNLYQVVAYRDGTVDYRRIAQLPGLEIHTILAGELDVTTPGRELLVFTRPGALYLVTPTGADGRFVSKRLQQLPGRVRDALVLPGRSGAPPEIATVGRDGGLRILTIVGGEPRWTSAYEATMGMGRIAVRPHAGPVTLYTTHDDGRILRHVRAPSGGFRTEVIHRGAQGPRGIAAGRFGADADEETIAVFGYGRNVELLSRREGRWRTATLFTDRDKGHWLATAELDGRNDTDEILLSGYGGRIVMLARPALAARDEQLTAGSETPGSSDASPPPSR